MAVRGIYTKAEQKMLDDTNEKFNSLVGWINFPQPLIATKESMINYAYAVDPKNPLWRDENYARSTRWGSLIAVPGFTEKLGVDPYLMVAPPELGYQKMQLIGEDDEIRKPIRMNDSFRVWRRRPQLKDVTSLDGKGPRTFTLMVEDFDLINQKDELVNTFKHYIQVTFLPEAQKPFHIPEYGYTVEELEYADRIEAGEEIHGSEIRYWEDVNIGDVLKPVILGPVSMSDMVALDVAHESGSGVFASGENSVFSRKAYNCRASGRGFEKDDTTGFYYYLGFHHYEDRAARAMGAPRSTLYTALSRHLLCRLVTNWMGDDGFIRTYHYRLVNPSNLLGEILIGRGMVENKCIDGSEHLVKLKVWIENMRGGISESAIIIVSVLSKKVLVHWK